MALDTLDSKRLVLPALSPLRGDCRPPRTSWTPLEDELLTRVWSDWLSPTGQAKRGFMAYALSILPRRTSAAIESRMGRLVKLGVVQRQWRRVLLTPVKLSPVDAAWLGGILDGEGHIRLSAPNEKRVVILCLCTNTNTAILERVGQLVPFACKVQNSIPRVDGRGIRSNLPCYRMILQNIPAIHNVLPQLLPYIHHSKKRKIALAMVDFVKSRVENGA